MNTSGKVVVQLREGGAAVIEEISSMVLSAGRFYHIEAGEAGDSWYIFVDGTVVHSFTSTSRAKDYGTPVQIGYNGASWFYGYMDEYRISSTNRHTGTFSLLGFPYGSGTSIGRVKIGSTRPLKGIHFVPKTANANPCVPTGVTWDGTGWTSLTNLVDGSGVAGATLAQEGTVSFDTTVSISKPDLQDGYFLYWYWLDFEGLASGVTISHCSVDAPFQTMKDLWDGVYRPLGGAYLYNDSKRVDCVLNLREDRYDSTDALTYVDLNTLSAGSEYVEFGFTEKMTALLIGVAFDAPNTAANCVASVDYWDGSAYKTVGTINDKTAENGKSVAKTGTVSWCNPNVEDERRVSVANGYPLYYYRVKWSQAITGAKIYHVSGATAPKTIGAHAFAVSAADRLMLGGSKNSPGNVLTISAANRTEVFNGEDFFEITFGGDAPLTCGAAIFAQYASNIYNMVILFKANETWTLTWDQGEEETIWNRYQIDPAVGCTSPKTIQAASVVLDRALNQTKVVGIWRGHNGIYMSNGQAPQCVSDAISSVFDQTKPVHANEAMIPYEVAFIDEHRMEYHWLFASGTSTTLDKEYVLDLRRWKWFEIDRPVHLQCGCSVSGNGDVQYAYGFTDAGYMMRLENGNTFDGTAIASTVKTGAQVLQASDIMQYMTVVAVNLIAVAKNTDSALTVGLYIDGDSGDEYDASLASTKRIANAIAPVGSDPGIFFEFEFSTSSSSEVKGFEPLYAGVFYQEDLERI